MAKKAFSTNSNATDIDKAVGANLRKMRKMRGLTLTQLADALSQQLNIDYTSQAIAMWEAGSRRMWAGTVIGLAAVLQCPVSMLLDMGDSDPGEKLQTISKRARQSLDYAFRWDGDKKALAEFNRLYMSLPPSSRERIAFAGLAEYERCAEDGTAATDLDVDAKLIESAWRIVRKKASRT